MSGLNTFINAHTAQNTRATAWGVNQLVTAGRVQELRARGWITPSSTPAEIAAVEAVLAAQMRAREGRYRKRSWPYMKVAITAVVGGFLLLLFTIAAVAAPRAQAGVLPSTVVAWLLLATVVGVAYTRTRRREARRSQVLGKAVVRDGKCQWCLRSAPHILEGEQTEPRVYHAIEIEQIIEKAPR